MQYDQHLKPVYPDTVKGKCRVVVAGPDLAALVDTVIEYEGFEQPDGIIQAWSDTNGALDLTVYPGTVMRPTMSGQVGAANGRHPDIASAKDMVEYFYRHRMIAR